MRISTKMQVRKKLQVREKLQVRDKLQVRESQSGECGGEGAKVVNARRWFVEGRLSTNLV